MRLCYSFNMRRSAAVFVAIVSIIPLVFSAAIFPDGTFLIGDQKPGAPVLLKEFYDERGDAVAWFKDEQLSPMVYDLLNALKQADREGLRPEDYHLALIQQLLDDYETRDEFSAPSMKILDYLLSDAYLTYGSDLLSGRINPYDVDDDWFAGRRTGDLPATLENALESGQIRAALAELLPTNPVYQRMRMALARYRQMERNGGWSEMPDGKPIQKGDRDARVVLLRRRLALEGDLNQKPNKKLVFDPTLERALMRFQMRNGLDPDGVLGKETLRVLNIPVTERVQQIRDNMERCRWLPDNLGATHIFVNVPSFTLQIVEDTRETMRMKVVVGRKMRQTPVFSSSLTHVIFNPPWSTPLNVAKLDMLDHIREEPDYLAKYNFEVFENYDEDADLVDPATVDWSGLTPQTLKYRFRQKPGPLNALGQVKFLLPNRFDVYLHDTPSRSLFSKTVRDFSSGCIRVEKPIELATYLLSRGNSNWTREKIEAAIDKKNEQAIPLAAPVPVHLMYWTMWVDEQDNVQFRDDLYGRDASLTQALNRETSL